MSRDVFRIAGACGFWGDRNDALADQVRGGPIDAVLLDYLAEVTLSILRVQKLRDPARGYATDFLKALAPVIKEIDERGIQVTTNAGGVNPEGCAQAVLELARAGGLSKLRVGVVTGDDLSGRLKDLRRAGVSLAQLDTGAPFDTIAERVISANAYLGAEPIADALRAGARIVVTGRCTDSALALGPLLAHFGWSKTDWDHRAAGVVAGHLLECGGQASGGNFAAGWESVPNLARLGYPIAEIARDGSCILTKHPTLGGLVTPAVLKEQLIYEIGDPERYVTPDAVADFTSLALEDLGRDRVRVSGARGDPPPDHLKVSIAYQDGWMNQVALTFVWPEAEKRARATADLLLTRAAQRGLRLDAHHVDLIGLSGAHGPMVPPLASDPNEVLLRVAVRSADRDAAEAFGEEIAPLVLCGVPGACSGLLSARPKAHAVVNFWPALVPRNTVEAKLEVLSP